MQRHNRLQEDIACNWSTRILGQTFHSSRARVHCGRNLHFHFFGTLSATRSLYPSLFNYQIINLSMTFPVCRNVSWNWTLYFLDLWSSPGLWPRNLSFRVGRGHSCVENWRVPGQHQNYLVIQWHLNLCYICYIIIMMTGIWP